MTLKNKNVLSEFFSGAGQLLDIRGTYYEHIADKYLNTPSDKLDSDALWSDWKAVGDNLRQAMEEYDVIKK